MMRITRQTAQGFTLVELLVTMALFTSVITIATGALFSAQAVNARLEQTQAILDGVNLATEVIVRDMRYGSSFYCDESIPEPMTDVRKGCPYPSGGSVIIFNPTLDLEGTSDGTFDRVAYYVSNGVLYKNEYPYQGQMSTQQITSSDVMIEDLHFYATGFNSANGASDYGGLYDYDQPMITMVLAGVTVPLKRSIEPVRFTIQTSASSRTLDK